MYVLYVRSAEGKSTLSGFYVDVGVLRNNHFGNLLGRFSNAPPCCEIKHDSILKRGKKVKYERVNKQSFPILE